MKTLGLIDIRLILNIKQFVPLVNFILAVFKHFLLLR